MSEGRLSTLDESLAQIGNAKCSSVGVANLEVNDRVAEKMRSIREIENENSNYEREIRTFRRSHYPGYYGCC